MSIPSGLVPTRISDLPVYTGDGSNANALLVVDGVSMQGNLLDIYGPLVDVAAAEAAAVLATSKAAQAVASQTAADTSANEASDSAAAADASADASAASASAAATSATNAATSVSAAATNASNASSSATASAASASTASTSATAAATSATNAATSASAAATSATASAASATASEAAATVVVTTDATTARTLSLGDKNSVVEFTSGSAITLTVPTNAAVALPIGCFVEVHQAGAGTVTVTPSGGVTLQSRDTLRSGAGQYAVLGLRKVAADVWRLYGDLA